jgi:hypothetical protein
MAQRLAGSVGGTSRPSAFAVLRLIGSLVLGRCLYRQVGRLLALEDAIDVSGGLPVLVKQISIRPPLSTWFAGNKLRAVYAVPRAPHGGLEVHSSLLNVVLHD